MSIFPQPQFEPSPGASTVYAPPAVRRSAGRAWLLSSILPGAGQMYCGANVRGPATLAVFVIGIAAAIFASDTPRWLALRTLIFLYAFAGLDAYLTAREHNRGIEADAPDNPRVAALLNFTTNGLGYVYAGQKLGWLVVIVMATLGRLIGTVFPLGAEALILGLAIHVAKIAQRRRDEAYPPDRLPPPVESSLPAIVPYIVSAVVLLGYYGLVTLAQILILLRR